MIQLQDNERILFFRRRHWLILVLSIVKIVSLMILLFVTPFLVTAFVPDIFTQYGALIFFASILVFEVLWVVLFLVITDYYLDAWIVTTGRLVFIELHGIFSRSLSSVEFDKIQDITVSVHGILPTFFKYGDIKMHTAGNEEGFVFEDIPRPYELKDKLLTLRDKGPKERVSEGSL